MLSKGLLVISLAVGVILSLILPAAPAAAASFDPNTIMSDTIFQDSSTMNPTQIDSFLNSQPRSCISPNANSNGNTGFRTPDPQGWSVSQNKYLYGDNVTAGQAIYDVSQIYHVNPQVLLSTMQKEQSLITGSAGCHYNSPDPASATSMTDKCGSGTRNCTIACTYSGGCMNIAFGYGCPSYCDVKNEGFSQQLTLGTWLLRFGEERALGNLTGYVGYESGDEGFTYSGPMTPGTWKRSASAQLISYDGTYITQDGTSVKITSGATASLYDFTPFVSGNQNFYNIFTNWFGSTIGVTPQPNAVWRLYNGRNGDHLLSASATEVNTYVNAGWHNDGVVAHGDTNGSPVYRLYNGKYHFYTTSTSELNTYLAAGWGSDGAIFNALTTGTPVFRLWNGTSHFVTASTSEFETYIKAGWHNDGIVFYEPTNEINPVWRLYNSNPQDHLLTASVQELTTYLAAGWHNDGIAMRAESSGGTPVYRLWNGSSHLYTTNTNILNTYVAAGWHNDGVVFNTAITGTPVYQLWNGTSHFYTCDTSELAKYVAAGWHNDGVVFNTSNTIAARRLYQPSTGAHMTVADINVLWNNEIAGWVDDGIQFYASTTNGTPVYQLYTPVDNSYFYTAEPSEVSAYVAAGWINQGITFYAPPGGQQAVYRLFGPNKTHILVATSQELSDYTNAGWHSDGIIFTANATP